jgi:transcription initiation factor TFIID subunit 6
VLHPPSDDPQHLNYAEEGDAKVMTQMREVLGDFFTEKLLSDGAWARAILGGTIS